MTQYGFYFDSTRCTGCRTCEIACKDYKDLGVDFAYRHVYDCEGGDWQMQSDGTYTQDCFVYHVSLGCQHCDDPACVKVCPTTAMHKDASTGLVSVDEHKCIGCGYCHMACPYNAPKVDREKGHSVKCNGCAERVAEGKTPSAWTPARFAPSTSALSRIFARSTTVSTPCLLCPTRAIPTRTLS